VIAQIKASSNLQLLKESLDSLLQKLNHSEMVKLQDEKKTIDARVEAQRYAFIARRRAHYEKVEEDFERINKFLSAKIEGVRQYERDMYKIDSIFEKSLFQDIFAVVQKSFQIDRQELKNKVNGHSSLDFKQSTHQVKVFQSRHSGEHNTDMHEERKVSASE